MGCDIYLHIEKRTPSGSWVQVEDVPDIYSDRNYYLYAILAGVRNEHGLDPIDFPRGVPSDVSHTVGQLSRKYPGYHSHSHFTVKQLCEYDWNKQHAVHGFVNVDGYRFFKEHGHPISYSRDVHGDNVEFITNDEMDTFIKDSSFDSAKSYHTNIQWQMSYANLAGNFHHPFLSRLQELAGDDTESLRIIFWFDGY